MDPTSYRVQIRNSSPPACVLYSIPGPGHTNPAATNHLFLNASRKRPASGSYLSRVERIKTSKREYLKKMKSPHWKKRYVLQGIDEIRKLLPKNK